MAGLSTLPDELVAIIFESCLQDRTHSPSSWLLTCRRLYHIAIPILYRHISVQLLKVFKLHHPGDGTKLGFTECIFHKTKSLTIHVPFAQKFDKPPAWSQEYIQESKTLISTMPSLTSLSIISRPIRRPTTRVRPFRLSRNAIADLLSVLPRTVTSLELAAPVVELPWDPDIAQGPARIYNELQTLIRQQLWHLRLRIPGLGEDFLSRIIAEPTSSTGELFPLRTALVMLSKPRYQRDVGDSMVHVEGLRISTSRGSHGGDKERRRIRLSADARALYTSGRLPHLKEFIVLDALSMNRRTEIVVRADAVVGDTSAYPIELLDGQSGARLAGVPTFDMKYVMRVVDTGVSSEAISPWKEFVASYGDLLRFIEGPATWTELPSGRRVPIDSGGDDQPPSPDRPIEDAGAFRTHSELSCPMLSEPEMSIRPGRIRHVPCAIDLQEVFEEGSSAGYEVVLTPEEVRNDALQTAPA
ncbi:hypothetical protein BJY00DRAFT_308533 [Aspergillus carlsbadensis]|nr:hypothetical protein BJY00DRAFT_308533 [Aspergillus carlsbadensis]